MTRHVLVLLGICLAQSAYPLSHAQEEEPPPERRESGQGSEWTDRAVDFLKDELDLDPKQEKEIRDVMAGVMQEAMKRMSQAYEGGEGFDPSRMRSTMEDLRLQVSERITKVLTPAQQREYEVLLDRFDRRSQGWEQRRLAEEDPAQAFEAPPISKRLLLAKAERSLFLGPKETAVVLPLVERVLERKIALSEGKRFRRQDLLNASEGGASGEELEERVVELRAAEQFLRLELLAAEEELRELLTLEQEIRLVAMGVLE